jgi:hypothetical protein
MGSLITVTQTGVSVGNATKTQTTFTTQYPFQKLDSLNSVSFQEINLFFAVDTPNPDGLTSFYNRTLVYKFPHGYNYVPSSWFFVFENTSTPIGQEGIIIKGGGDTPGLTSAVFIVNVDKTNVYFYIDKYYNQTLIDLGIPFIGGVSLLIRSYIFVEDLLGNSVPTQA